MKFHSTYVGVDGGPDDYFVILYLQDDEGGPVYPHNIAEDLDQTTAENLAQAFENASEGLLPLVEALSYILVEPQDKPASDDEEQEEKPKAKKRCKVKK